MVVDITIMEMIIRIMEEEAEVVAEVGVTMEVEEAIIMGTTVGMTMDIQIQIMEDMMMVATVAMGHHKGAEVTWKILFAVASFIHNGMKFLLKKCE